MATRFYLPASGSAPLGSLAIDSNWELSTGLVRLPTFTIKQNTALATDTRTWAATSTQQWCWFQFQSKQLLEAYNWTTSDAISMVLGKCGEQATGTDTHLNYCIRVVSADGSTIRGIIGAVQASPGDEYPLIASAATRIRNASTNGATNFSSQAGDRIIIEIGVHGVTPTASNVQHRIGDPSGTSDFALTTGLTTDLCSWVELSRTVLFGFSDSRTESASATSSTDAEIIAGPILADTAETSTGSETQSAIKTGPAERAESSTVSDSPSAVNVSSTETAESGSGVDTKSAVIATDAGKAESATLIESQSSGLLSTADTEENASAVDSRSAIATMIASILESSSAVDSRSGIMIAIAIISESSPATSSEGTMAAVYDVYCEEIGSTVDTNTSLATLLTQVLESGTAVDTPGYIGGGIIEAIIAEEATATDVKNALSIISDTIEETVNSLDTSDGLLPVVIDAAVNEALQALDLSSITSITYKTIYVNSMMHKELVLQSRMTLN